MEENTEYGRIHHSSYHSNREHSMDGFTTNRTISINNGDEQIFATVGYNFRRTYKHGMQFINPVQVFKLDSIEILSIVSTTRTLTLEEEKDFEPSVLVEAGKKSIEL
jgi:hypothetical protein